MSTDRPSRADDQRHLRRSKAWSWSFLVVTYGRRILHGTLERDADSATWKTRWMERPTSMAQHTRRSRRRAAQPPHNRAFRPARSVWPDWAAPCFWEEVPWTEEFGDICGSENYNPNSSPMGGPKCTEPYKTPYLR